MSSPTPTIKYVPNPQRPLPSEVVNDEDVLFGFYKICFPDGWTVALPHVGLPNTVGATPFDLGDDEQRARILEWAERSRPA